MAKGERAPSVTQKLARGTANLIEAGRTKQTGRVEFFRRRNLALANIVVFVSVHFQFQVRNYLVQFAAYGKRENVVNGRLVAVVRGALNRRRQSPPHLIEAGLTEATEFAGNVEVA